MDFWTCASMAVTSYEDTAVQYLNSSSWGLFLAWFQGNHQELDQDLSFGSSVLAQLYNININININVKLSW